MSLRVRFGELLDRVGQALFPATLGAVAGFWAADQGMRLLPTMAEVVLAAAVSGLVLIAVGNALRGKLYEDRPQGIVVRRRVMVGLGVAVVLGIGRLALWYAELPTGLTRLEPAQFEAAFALDTQRYRDSVATLERLNGRLEASELPRPGNDVVLTPDEEAQLLDTWQALHDLAIELDGVRLFWEGWYGWDPSRAERSYHLRSFLLTYAAELALYEHASRFTQRALRNDNARTFLDARHPERDMPAGSFSHFREALLGTRDQARIVAGAQYLDALALGTQGRDEADALGVGWLWKAVEGHLAGIDRVAPIDRATLTVRADLQLFRRGLRRALFPIQAGTAEWMGDARVRRVGRYLIPEAQQEELEAKLLPGDILIARKNWYLSNVGLPGFWPHAILYVGGPEKLRVFGESAEVRAWVASQGGQGSLTDWIARRWPVEYGRFVAGQDGHEMRVIEAISEGVSLSSFPHVTGDYVAAMRPRYTDADKARAIVNAFSHLGKPYDFDFDFATDHAIVCTELVWRAWRPAEFEHGVEFPLVRSAGRSTLPANEMARYFDQTVGTERQDLDFVAFVDAREKDGSTFFADEAAFRQTWRRPKWDVLQE